MELSDLSAELQAKMQKAASPEELLALSREEGIELSDEDLEKVSGGWDSSGGGSLSCPICGSADVTIESIASSSYLEERRVCHSCGNRW